MKKALFKFFVCAAVALASMCSLVQGSPVLKNGERMVFLGDSITEQRIYTRYVMDYFALRCPDSNITFRNAGWGGDTAPGGLNRLERDVLSLKPDVVSICFGMNDGGYGPFNKDGFVKYMNGISGLVSELKKAGIRVVLLTPGCVDPDKNVYCKGYNDTLALYAEGVVDFAAKERLPVYNIQKQMLDVQTQAKNADPSFCMIPDGVHPNPAGHALMAYGLLRDLGYTDSASGLEIDAGKASFVPDRCTVTDLKIAEDAVKFTRKDAALPTYFAPEVSGLVKFAPYLSDMNAYKFKVTGLKAGTWKLTVQGMEVGKFSADDLAAGVDLSNLPGPWKKLGEDINASSQDQENIYFMRWRQVDLIGIPTEAKHEADALLKKMDNMIASREAERAKAVANRTWTWTLNLEK